MWLQGVSTELFILLQPIGIMAEAILQESLMNIETSLLLFKDHLTQEQFVICPWGDRTVLKYLYIVSNYPSH